ncbi:putative C2H2 finger domain protein [Aspergillus avenaceus]|uniref:Putative C2H2 finger domain protein n=1 Tax=Aspergillus avenaceus TaxID=36643 RepID=A0A5N6TYB0_ASPAV|nr:putative C2H2 finger domain protein [Aspergillus avenaceus]
MQTHTDHPDFTLFSSQDPRESIMSEFDSSRQQQTPYFHLTMDSGLIEPFIFPLDGMNGFGQAAVSSQIPQPSYFDTPDAYSDNPKTASFPPMPATPPSVPTSHSSEPFMPGLSTASGPSIASASSSAVGSPYSGAAPAVPEDWVDTNHGLGLPAAVMGDLFPNEYFGNPPDLEAFYSKKYVDPSWIETAQPQTSIAQPSLPYTGQPDYTFSHGSLVPQSPETSHLHIEDYQSEQAFAQHPSNLPISSPLMHPGCAINERRSSISSERSRRSQFSPAVSNADFDDEPKEKGRCPHPDCGRVFKDLKAHLLTHRSERPEKCPIVTCEYHIKGFARKYDKNRHTLTHYKGTMVCGFCPGSGSPAEKSFNRADVFKRHLTSVHGVEQTPPNCRKKSPALTSGKAVSSYSHDATGKCSTCSVTFNSAQDFYEHLDDCVLRVVQQEEPSEAINQQRLAEVESDEEVKKTMEKHMLLDTPSTVDQYDEDMDDEEDEYKGRPAGKTGKGNSNAVSRTTLGNNAISKRPNGSKKRNNRDRYPQSWGCPRSTVNTKKRVLCVFDGQRRLWKDEMMLNNEFEVRVKLPGGAGDGTNREAYVTDLDVETLKRAEGVLSANDEERGPWVDGPSTHLIGQSVMALPNMSHPYESEVNIDDLLS